MPMMHGSRGRQRRPAGPERGRGGAGGADDRLFDDDNSAVALTLAYTITDWRLAS